MVGEKKKVIKEQRESRERKKGNSDSLSTGAAFVLRRRWKITFNLCSAAPLTLARFLAFDSLSSCSGL
jgi:hypothetical protein